MRDAGPTDGERRSRRGAGRIGRWLAALAGAGAATMAPAASHRVAPSAAPAEWVAYATRATATVTQWLRAPDDVATRVRGWLAAARQAQGPSPAANQAPPLVVKLWVARDGKVSRIAFTPFVQDEANADLRAALVGRKLDGPPPRRMLQPMILAVQLDPRPAVPTPAVDLKDTL